MSGVHRVGSAGVRVGSVRVFKYQHVGISNAKSSRWGFRPTRGANAMGFALRWNISLRIDTGGCSVIRATAVFL